MHLKGKIPSTQVKSNSCGAKQIDKNFSSSVLLGSQRLQVRASEGGVELVNTPGLLLGRQKGCTLGVRATRKRWVLTKWDQNLLVLYLRFWRKRTLAKASAVFHIQCLLSTQPKSNSTEHAKKQYQITKNTEGQ